MALRISCPHCGHPHRLQQPYPLQGSEITCQCGHRLAITYPAGLVERLKGKGVLFGEGSPNPQQERPSEQPPQPEETERIWRAERQEKHRSQEQQIREARRRQQEPGRVLRKPSVDEDEPDTTPFGEPSVPREPEAPIFRLRSGVTLGGYVIEARVGVGGMATVYRARHQLLEYRCAIKVLHPHLLEKQELRMRFLEEGKIQARLRHPNIVWIFGILSEPGVAGLVMEWLDGQDLGALIDGGGAIDEDVALEWALQALDALRHVHSAGIIHRDLKPDNLFIEDTLQGRRVLRMMDFGIAKVSDRRRTRTNTQVGTLAYMSPEQAQSARDVDQRSDLFAMGAILYEMLEGRAAFDPSGEETPIGILQRIATGQHAPFLKTDSPALRRVISKAMDTEPDNRFSDAAAFANALHRVVDR